MAQETFYKNNNMTPTLEYLVEEISTFEEFEERFTDEFLREDARGYQTFYKAK